MAVGYDVELIQVELPASTKLPLSGKESAALRKQAIAFEDLDQVRTILLGIEGSKSGPDDSIDYMGRGLNYARFIVRPDTIYVDNNCGARELLKIYEELKKAYPNLLIYDLQNGNLHNAESMAEWWARPL